MIGFLQPRYYVLTTQLLYSIISEVHPIHGLFNRETLTVIMVQRERCPCSWKNCRDYAYNEDDIWYGFVQIRKSKSNSAKKNELRRVVEHHLRIPRDIKAENKQYSVARHHWCRLLLGDYYKTRRISTSIPSYIAKQYRIDEQINRSRVTINSSVTHYTAAPSNPEASVKEWHNLQCSQKSTRRISREENQARLTGNTSQDIRANRFLFFDTIVLRFKFV